MARFSRLSCFVTDYSLASGLGSNKDDFRRGLFGGLSGIQEFREHSKELPVKAFGYIQGLRLDVNPVQTLIKHLLDELSPTEPPDGVVFCIWPPTTLVGQQLRSAIAADPLKGLMEAALKERFGTKPELLAINQACVSGLSVVGLAAHRIHLGIWKNAISLAIDLRSSPIDVYSLHQLGAVSTRSVQAGKASCPFSGTRDGFVKSEGGAAVSLSSKPGAAPWAKVVSYAQTADAWRLVEGRPDRKGIVEAMKRCLKLGQIQADEVSCISAHGTSTLLNDYFETLAIKEVFGSRAYQVPITALKSQLGHAMAASGTLQVIGALETIRNNIIPATINCENLDPECDLDYVADQPRPQEVRSVLCNAFAFGGHNAGLLLSAK